MKRREAFTLIELLVVISIIALLLSILMPALGRAKKLAQRTVCMGNLSSISKVMFVYANNYDYKLTPDWWSYSTLARDNLNVDYGDVMWQYCTQNYWTDPKILYCPSATKIASVDGYTPDNRAPKEWGHTFWAWYTPWAPPLKATKKPCSSSYGVNDFACTPYRSTPEAQREADRVFWRTLDQKGGDRIPLAFDCAWYSIMPHDNQPPPADPLDKCHMQGNDGFDPICLPRHLDQLNMLFMDGSVRTVSIKSLWTYKWNKVFDTTNQYTKPDYNWPEWIRRLKK